MAPSNEHGIKIVSKSSLMPGCPSRPNTVYEPKGMDLAMKLHYLRIVYYFPSQAFKGLSLTNEKIKGQLSTWLNHFKVACGRCEGSKSRRPCIKCDDCGVKCIDAQCVKTLDEWLEMKNAALEKLLVSDQIIGPKLAISPLVYMQYTKFKCGGMAVGLSWAHVLGDASSAADFVNTLGKVLAGNEPATPLNLAKTKPAESPNSVVEDPLSVKLVARVEDKWITVNNCKLETFSFHVTNAKLVNIQSKLSAKNDTKIAPFESLCAVIWKIIAKIRHSDEPKIVTICQKDATNREDVILSNSQIVSVVKVDFSVANANNGELKLAANLKNPAIKDERKKIEDAMERAKGLADFLLYGANLTFVNFEEVNFYGFQYQRQSPVWVSCMIDGVGDNGAVLVLPGPKNGAQEGNNGRIVTVILPENEVLELKSALKREWSIA